MHLKHLILIVFTTFLLFSSFTKAPSKKAVYKKYNIEGFAQGTSFQIIYYAKNQKISSKSIYQLFGELDSSLSIYKPYSLINKFNSSESGIEMDEHLEKVLKRSIEIWRESDGIFDVGILNLMDVWGFGIKKQKKTPSDAELTYAISCSGSDKLSIKGNRLTKSKACLKIDVNGIAQGYSVDYIAEYLEEKGIKNYLIELGGEIRVRGKKQPENEYMRIGIDQPFLDDKKVIGKTITLKSGALTSSANYPSILKKNFEQSSFLIDSKSGKPLLNQIISVSVRAKNAMDADAYDNVLMGMTLGEGLRFLEKNKKIEAYFIYKDENGIVRDTSSRNFFR